MKLRNKKTGEITDLAKNGFLKSDNDDHIIVYQEGTLKYYAYNSLAELNEEWEDYAPVEPLIKDSEERGSLNEDAAYWMAAYLCDAHGLTEHGTCVHSAWLSELGKEWLEKLKNYEEEK